MPVFPSPRRLRWSVGNIRDCLREKRQGKRGIKENKEGEKGRGRERKNSGRRTRR